MKRAILPVLLLLPLLLLFSPFAPIGAPLHFVPVLVPDFLTVAVLVIGACIAGVRLWKREAAGWNVGALLVLGLGFFALRPEQPASFVNASSELRAMTLNAKMSAQDHGRLVDLVRTESMDVLLLQENYGEENSPAEAVKAAFPNWHAYRVDALAVVSRWPIKDSKYTPLGRFKVNGLLEAEIARPSGAFRVVNVHWEAPHVALLWFSATRERELRLTREAIHRSEKPTIFGGDFNSPPRYGGIQAFKREFGPTAVGYTYQPKSTRPVVQLDYLWGKKLTMTHTKIGPDVGSDHLPVLAAYASKP